MDDGAPMDEMDPNDGLNQVEMQPDPSLVYWGNLSGKELASAVKDKQRAYFESAKKRGLLGMWIVSYAAFHGLDPDSMSTFQTQQLGFDGEEAEFLRICINIVRTYIQRQATSVLSQDPVFKARCENSDVAAQLDAKMSDDIANYVFKRATEGQKLRDATIVAGVVGAAFGHMRWDASAGDTVTVDKPVIGPDGQQMMTADQNGQPIPATHPQQVKSGAPKMRVGYPWTVVQEPEEQDDTLWRTVRVADNKWQLAATHGASDQELTKQILNANTDDEYDFGSLFGFEGMSVDNKDAVTSLHFYHARCAAVPNGRYCIILGDLVLWDGPCPTSEGLPIAEMCPARFITTTFGYAPSWDLLSIQQAQNQILSDQLSNIATYGRQSVAMEKGTEITVDALAAGNKGFFYPQGGSPPQAVLMNDIGTGPQALQAYLDKKMDDVSGQNAAARGDPDANVKSGQFAALLHTISSEYMSYWQESEDAFAERVANIGIDMVRQYGQTKFLYEAVGIENRPYIREYTAADLSGFKSVAIETTSPAMRNYAGRLDMFSQLKDFAPADRAAAYEFISTGRSDAFMRKDRNGQLCIDRENESLLKGDRPVQVGQFDDPFKHVPEHRQARDGMMASDNPDQGAIQRIDQHIVEHATSYGDMHPFIASFLGIQPPPPIPGTNSFDFAESVAQGQLYIQMASQGQQPPGMGGPQPQQPQPGQAGSGQPANGNGGAAQRKLTAGGPGGDNSTGAAQPGGSNVDTSGTPLPKAAQPPPSAATA